ncbi:MAG: LexA repressor [Alphaproteobacteria bacterium]|jgi:repressor LexA|nr:MAG: LexA repressor [Alphaproteobacteria bacterium]|tara:strand:+ start:294 stop:923 length:630 start_codon:yes stop_codon:yes gene_type:complete
MLTFQQEKLLKFIIDYQKQNNVTPSFDEMKDGLDLKSKSGIHRIVSALEERGYIKKLNNRARAIEIIKNVNLIDTESGKNKNNIISIPILGKIAAGLPIEAISDNTNYIELPETLLKKGEYFILNVEGDSMIEAGIFDGDQVVIRKANDANNGEIVVALIDNNEATLKRIFKRGQQVALQPENSNYKTVIYGPDRIQIQGVLKHLIRSY